MGHSKHLSLYDINRDAKEAYYSFETLPPPARDRLIIAISGRGAFRRFKDEVRRLGVEKAWYEYRDAAQREKAIEWCEENGIEFEE